MGFGNNIDRIKAPFVVLKPEKGHELESYFNA